MNIKRLKFLLQQIYLKKEIVYFNEIYDYKENFIKKYVNNLYKYVRNKTLYSKNDIIQEIWLNVLLHTQKEEILIKDLNEFNYFLIGVIYDVLIETNNKEL